MKILFPYMARWHAVNWTRYHSLLASLGEIGYEVHVLQPPPLESAETNYQEISPRNFKNIHLHDVRINQWLWNKRFPFDKLVKKAIFSHVSYKYARQLITNQAIDAILLYNIPQYRFSTIKNVIQLFDYADDYIDMLAKELGTLGNTLTLGLANKTLTKMFQNADIILSVSHELAKLVPSHNKVHVLANGVKQGALTQQDKSTTLKVRNGNKPIVGFLGAFEYFIDFDLILEAAQQLPSIHFLLVGTGRDWQKVKTKVENNNLSNVQLTGGVPHTDVFQYISAMDICLNIFTLIPVSHRACPIKLFEYMSQKKPVISSRLDELAYIDKGFLHYADTPAELVEAIQKILINPQQAHAMAIKGYELTKKEYTWENIAMQFHSMLTAIRT